MAEVEIGIYKSARQAYGFDDIAIVPSRRTRDPEDVDISWQIDAYKFELPVLGSAMDGAMSPDTAIELGRLGGLGVLNLEGLWTRYEDPMPLFEEIRELDDDKATARMQQMYLEPIKIELVAQRIKRDEGRGHHDLGLSDARAHRLDGQDHPRRRPRHPGHPGHRRLGRARLQDRRAAEPEEVHPRVRSCRSSWAAARATRPRCTSCAPAPPASSSASVPATPARRARCSASAFPRRRRSPTSPARACATWTRPGVYVHVIADGGMSKGGDIAKAIACGADAVMIGSPLTSAVEAPARGFHWGMATFHPTLPRGTRVRTQVRGTLKEVLLGPAHENDGRLNLFGALRTSMATCGYETLKEFQKAEIMLAPSLQTEGKQLQRSQGVGMGH